MKGSVTLNRALFERLADAIDRARDKAATDREEAGVHLVASEIADDFASLTKTFDREIFMRNCGLRS